MVERYKKLVEPPNEGCEGLARELESFVHDVELASVEGHLSYATAMASGFRIHVDVIEDTLREDAVGFVVLNKMETLEE